MTFNSYTVAVPEDVTNIAEWAINWCTGESQIMHGGLGAVVRVADPGEFTHPDAEFIGQEVTE